jgi:hypothetical protein
MEPYKISNHPTSGYVRFAEVADIVISLRRKVISLVIEISHYKEEGAFGIIIANKDVSLHATQDTWLDAEGNIVPEGEGVITEYDYFMLNWDKPIILNDLCIIYIQRGDANGRFD